MRLKRFSLTLGILMSICICGQNNVARRYFKAGTKQELQNDIKFLKGSLEAMHPQLFRYSNQQRFDSIFTSVLSEIKDSISQPEFQQLVGKCLSAAHCLHTRLALNKDLFDDINSYGVYIPIKRVRVEGEKIFVVATADTAIKAGDEIIQINSIPASAILKKGYAAISSDRFNSTFKTYAINEFFFFIFYSFINQSTTFELTLRRDHETLTLHTKGLKTKDFWNAYYKLNSVNVKPVWYNALDSGKIGYIKLNSFRPDDYLDNKIDYKLKFKEIFKNLKKDQTQNLIIDLRGCQGGSIEIPMEFLSYILQKPFKYNGETYLRQEIPAQIKPYVKEGTFFNFPNCKKEAGSANYIIKSSNLYKPKKISFQGKIFFIVDGGTLSASGMLMAIIKNLNLGQIIGEETAGSFYTGAKGMEIRLPNTGVIVEISYRTGLVVLEGEIDTGHGVMPDFNIRSTITDITHQKDAELDFIKEVIRRQ